MTPQQIDAMKQALEALKKCHYYMIDAGLPNQSLLNEAFTAYKALEALKEHAMRETQRLGQEIEQAPYSVQQAYAMAQVCLDLHEAIGCKWGDNIYFAIDQLKAVAQPPQRTEQEPVADALHFAHWTTDKKDLSDYILVGSLTLAGIEDGEYGASEIDPLDNTIDALQERLVTGSDHKKVPLLAYIGALKPTTPQRKPLTEQEIGAILEDINAFGTRLYTFARAIEAAHGIKENT